MTSNSTPTTITASAPTPNPTPNAAMSVTLTTDSVKDVDDSSKAPLPVEKRLTSKEDDIVGILETNDVKDLKPNDRVLIKAYGVHMNGYIDKDGQKFMLIGKRSQVKPTYPRMLDHLVFGGLV
ncbi:hypothetical protein HHK36_030284 [Tetracentron sinense]|uniref:Uncharacterized protein n=1 Tax=Tetracentron sinense TaxID=13715 RepID=A0A834YCK5_TETSI|nr:hypothetical protein HHK36_030284 [Tetracentron sinense]